MTKHIETVSIQHEMYDEKSPLNFNYYLVELDRALRAVSNAEYLPKSYTNEDMLLHLFTAAADVLGIIRTGQPVIDKWADDGMNPFAGDPDREERCTETTFGVLHGPRLRCLLDAGHENHHLYMPQHSHFNTIRR